jgi:hypothetical protein
MKRLMIVLLGLVLLGPAVAVAQETAPPAIDPATFGEGWENREPVAGGRGLPGVWDWRFVYGGPDGAMVTIDVYRMGPSMSDAASQWEEAAGRWQTRTLFELVGPVAMIPATDSPLPFGATDALRADDLDSATNEPAALGLYALPDQDVALMVRVHGTVASRSGVTALNWIVLQWLDAQA